MGDMKTPDFDDLLAAFDIPDIDAKEAIQSNSGDPDVNHSESSGAGGKERSGGPSQRPTSSSDVREGIPLSSHDLSTVSVIVKNSVCSDVYISDDDEDEDMVRQVRDVLDEVDRSGGGSLLSGQLLPRTHSLLPSDALIHNGFKAVSDSTVEASQMQPNGQLWSLCSPKPADEGNQDSSSCSHTAIFPSHMPLPVSAPSTSAIGLLPSKVDEHTGHHSSPISSSLLDQSLNSTSNSGVSHPLCEDEESEPDLESPPLMIQESPDLQMSPHRHGSSSDFPMASPSSHSLPISKSPVREETSIPQQSPPPGPHQTPPQSSSMSACMTEKNDLPNAEQYPEHIIDERDSPESPEAETPGRLQERDDISAATQKISPMQPSTSLLTTQVGVKEPGQVVASEVPDKNHAMENGGQELEDGDQLMKSDADRIKEDMKVDTGGIKSLEPATENSTDPSLVPSRPLKVRIKTVKTLTGNITRTVTRVAPKAATGGTTKGPDGAKLQLGGRKVLSRPKRPAAAVCGQPQVSKTAVLPVATLQDASAAMLFAASKAQKVAAPACAGLKVAAVPPTSSSPPKTAVAARMLARKTVRGAVTSVRPASVTSSPGAAISRSQSSLVEAFNKILNGKNPLPSYQPDLSTLPPPEWGLGLPATGYRCLECGDAFALERSLARHYDRRSLRIEVTCNHCGKRLVFFNKCSLLLHAREHKDKGLVMQCSHLVMRPVSVEQMIGQPDTVPVGVLSPPLLAAACVPGVEESSVQSGTLETCCPECNSPFSSRDELATHFQRAEPSAVDKCCMQCSPPMPLWNPCSATAHRRLHQQLSPLVCPECGFISQPHSLSTHVQQACLHYTRQLGHRCACCQLVFGGVNSLNAVKTHMQTAHCEVFHKCPSCPMAFKSASSADAHCIAQHPDLSNAAKQSKEIYKCVMCRNVFTQKALLNVHFDTHLVKQKVHVFKCPDCNKVFTQRGSLLEHVKASHRSSAVHLNDVSAQRSSMKMESSDGEEWRRDDEEDGGRVRNSVTVERPRVPDVLIWSCSACRTRYTDKESYISHMANQHGKELKRFPCTLCEGSFSSSSSLRRHIRVKHKGIKRATFHCQLCTDGKKSFSSKLILEKHMQIHHGGQRGATGQSQVCPRSTDPADSSSEQDGAPNTVTGASEEYSSLTEGCPTLTGRGRLPQEQEVVGFRCMPCGFVSEDKAEFQNHIKSHRGDGGGTVQCQQCGACFASGSSLSRHRFISHRMRDTAAKRPRTPSPDVDDGQSNAIPSPTARVPSPSSPLQVEEVDGKLSCRVCRCQFSKAADLNTHFRTHGMAFLTSYKTDKPN